MRIQLFCGELEPSKDFFNPIKNRMAFVKADGGLWTSTYVKKYGSDWVRGYEEMFGIPDEGLDAWILIPEKNLKIYEIDSLEDLILLHGKYELNDPFSSIMKVIDYEKMARDYDGLHLTEKGQWETRFSHPHSLYGWDVECTHWFKWCFEKVEYIGKVGVEKSS